MKRPAFQFYTKDWKANLKLRRCSDAAKGAWVEILCVLHDSEEYGVARFPLRELVAAAGVQMKSVRELVEKGVLKGGDRDVDAYRYTPSHAGKKQPTVILLEASKGPMWYCSRFVRDEYIRGRRGESTRFDGNNQPPNGGPKDPPKDSPKHAPKPPFGERHGDGSAVAVASAVESLNQHQRLQATAASPPVDNPRPEGRKGHCPTVAGDTPWQAKVRAEGWRKGLEPRAQESWDEFDSRVRTTRAAA